MRYVTLKLTPKEAKTLAELVRLSELWETADEANDHQTLRIANRVESKLREARTLTDTKEGE
jgi:hypothetical protein